MNTLKKDIEGFTETTKTLLQVYLTAPHGKEYNDAIDKLVNREAIGFDAKLCNYLTTHTIYEYRANLHIQIKQLDVLSKSIG